MDPKEAATELRRIVEETELRLRQLTDQIASQPKGPGKWSRKEILGHLIDSASNNHQRFVRLQLAPQLEAPGYQQEGWVQVQHYGEQPWTELVSFWAAYNRHLAHVMGHIEAEHLGSVWKRNSEEFTLRFLVEDYLTHLNHHLEQIL